MSEAATVEEIPVRWRKDVCEVLDSHPDKVGMSARVIDEWSVMSDFGEHASYVYHLCAVLSEALKKDGITGTKIKGMNNDPGEIWEFKFGDDRYGKISLRLVKKKGSKSVYIYSAHKAERKYL